MKHDGEHTVVYKLFHYYFEWMIPEKFANEYRLQLEGVPIHRSVEQDDLLAERMVHRQHTVIEMIGYHKRGARIVLVNPEDSVKIYEWLNEYLTFRKEQSRYNVSIKNIPIEDIQDMDEFAAVIYRIARQYENKDVLINGDVERKRRELFRHRPMKSRIAPKERPPEASSDQPVEVKVSEHQPVADDISRDILSRSVNYNRR